MHGWQSELMDRKVADALSFYRLSDFLSIYLSICLSVYLAI